MFREYLHRTYRGLTHGRRKRRASTITRTGRPATTRLAAEGLEERTLLSTLTLTNGALVYAPSTNINTTLTPDAPPARQVVFFEPAVAGYEVLRQGLAAGRCA